MSKSIYLSENHGVNPSLECCFFCGEPMGVALFGRLPGDAEAPRKVITGYDPCPKCLEGMKQGVAIFETAETPVIENMPPINAGNVPSIYLTGNYIVITKEAAQRIFSPEMYTNVAKAGNKAFVNPDAWNLLTKDMS